MTRLLKAFFFRLSRDMTFKITLIIGAGVALFLTFLYFILDKALDSEEFKFLTGQSMLVGSLSPVQNFGIAIPVNLITYTVLEFNQGSIRNKIISGHSKAKVYLSLFISGLIFCFAMLITYVLICFGLGTIFGGFDPHGYTTSGLMLGGAKLGEFYILKLLAVTVLVYISIVAFTIFFAALFRNIGPSIPVVIMTLMVMYLLATILTTIPNLDDKVIWAARIIDPLYAMSSSEFVVKDVIEGGEVVGQEVTVDISKETFISGLISNTVYALLFFFGGLVIFKKRDIK